jgi:hypothetical protein
MLGRFLGARDGIVVQCKDAEPRRESSVFRVLRAPASFA